METAELRAAAAAAHTSFALSHGYEALIRAARGVTAHDVERLKEQHAMIGDPRDVLAARDTVKSLLGLSVLDA